MIPVKLADTDDAPAADKCATCTRCGHTAEGSTARGAITELARSCPGETVHRYYASRLPDGVRFEYVHRGRRLPCHLIDRQLVGGGGAISLAAPVFAVCETEAVARGRALGKLVAMLGPKKREAREAVPAKPGRKAKAYRPAYTTPGRKVTVEVEYAATPAEAV